MADWCDANPAADALWCKLERVKKMRADERAALRALATKWENEAEKTWASVDAMRGQDADTEARADVGEARAEECDAHAKAIFAIIGREER